MTKLNLPHLLIILFLFPASLPAETLYGTSAVNNIIPTIVNLILSDSVVYTLEEIIAEMPSSSWKKINNNHFIDVWTPLKQRPEPIGNTIGKPDRVISAWSSMALDSHRSHLIFWGGGHANYAGNEVYLFNLNTLLWQRASLPSDVYNLNNTGQYVTVDGTDHSPISAHTYDNQLYLPIIDRFITFGGAVFGNTTIFVKEDEITMTGPYLWDPNRADPDKVGGLSGSNVLPEIYPGVLGGKMWQNRDTVEIKGTGQYRPDWFVNGTTAYTQENGKDVVLVNEINGGLYKYTIDNVFDSAFDAWEKVGTMSSSYFDQGAGAYAPEKKIYIRTGVKAGEPVFIYWDLSNPGPNNPNHIFLPTDLSGGFSLSTLHGMDYDSFNQRFTLWDGNEDVWYLYPPEFLSENGWLIEKAQQAFSKDKPKQSDGIRYAANGSIGSPFRGVLGKWKYSGNHGVFFGVLDPVAGDIWVYKP